MEEPKLSSSRRPAILMGILLLLLMGYLVYSHVDGQSHVSGQSQIAAPPARSPTAPLAGQNSLSKLEVHQDKAGLWVAEFDYFYTGEPRMCGLKIELLPPESSISRHTPPLVLPPERGAHHFSVRIQHPGTQQTTQQVLVTLQDQQQGHAIATQRVDQIIDWPSFTTWIQAQQLAGSTPEQNLERAAALIDANPGPQLDEPKYILEHLLSQDPKLDAAYVQLARIAIRSNPGPEGLHQAENLLSSALEIRPDSANAKILLGHVYTKQHHLAQAQALFSEVAKSDPPNLWLWENWGELLVLQHRYAEAESTYRRAIAHPVTHDTNDRARKATYSDLLQLLGQRKDLDGMEALYKQQIADYGPGSCYSSEYARFLLQVRGDTQGAIDLARRALNQDCEDSPAREVLGLAEYVKWTNTTGPERAESLNQARMFLPAGPTLLYLLAASERTSPAIKQLIATGEQIDQKDNEKRTALSYALQNEDLGAARRLLVLRARPDTPVGYENIPVALIPVTEGNVEGIRLMRQFGVDYSKLRFRGITAFDFAKQMGNNAVLEALGHAATTL
jgi:tetratricopeptide (TPR) repeat protein